LTVTKEYLAPELSKGSWDALVATPSMDIWSLGIMLLDLFKGPELRTIHGVKSLDQLASYDQKDLDDPLVGLINKVFTDHKFVKDAILGCLQIDPRKRKTAAEIYDLITCVDISSKASIRRQAIETNPYYQQIIGKLDNIEVKIVDVNGNVGKLIDAVNLSNSSYEDSRLAMRSLADKADEMIKRFDDDRMVMPDFDSLFMGMTHELGNQLKRELKDVYEVINSSQEKTGQQEVMIRDLLERLHASFEEEEADRNATSLTLVLDFQKTLVNMSSTLLHNKHDRPTLFIIFKESDLKVYLDQAIEISRRNAESKANSSSSNNAAAGNSSSRGGSSLMSRFGNGFKNGWTKAKDYASSLVKDRYRVFFVCGYTHQIAMSGRDGLGYVFTDTKGWVKRYTPLLKLMFGVVKVGVCLMLPAGIPFPGIPDLGLDELGIDHLKKNFSELATKALDDKKQDVSEKIGGGGCGGGVNSSSVAASSSTADSTISSAVSNVEWEKEGFDNDAYSLAKEILDNVKDTNLEHTGLEQVTPMSGPNQGKTRWIWKDSTYIHLM
jgi:serine/threonine protein kinase